MSRSRTSSVDYVLIETGTRRRSRCSVKRSTSAITQAAPAYVHITQRSIAEHLVDALS